MASKKKTVPKETWPRFPEEPRPEDLTLNAPTVEEQMDADWATLKGKDPPVRQGEIPRMTPDELKQFVLDYLANVIFTSANIRASDQNLLGMIFLPLALGGLELFSEEAVRDVGILYAYMKDSMPRSINGYPIFGAMRVMHKDDWARASMAIKRETDHQRDIEV